MKTIATLVLVLVLGMGLVVVGCGGGESNAPGNRAAAKRGPATQPVAASPEANAAAGATTAPTTNP